MGEPAIPNERERQLAINHARAIVDAVRNDEEQDVYPIGPARGVLEREARDERELVIFRMACTIDLLNTALQRACDLADEPNGIHVSITPEQLSAEIKQLRAVGLPVKFCAICDKRPAVCLGKYEDHCPNETCTEACAQQHEDEPACDECCGHGNEDGHCSEIDHPAIVLEG